MSETYFEKLSHGAVWQIDPDIYEESDGEYSVRGTLIIKRDGPYFLAFGPVNHSSKFHPKFTKTFEVHGTEGEKIRFHKFIKIWPSGFARLIAVGGQWKWTCSAIFDSREDIPFGE